MRRLKYVWFQTLNFTFFKFDSVRYATILEFKMAAIENGGINILKTITFTWHWRCQSCKRSVLSASFHVMKSGSHDEIQNGLYTKCRSHLEFENGCHTISLKARIIRMMGSVNEKTTNVAYVVCAGDWLAPWHLHRRQLLPLNICMLSQT